MKTEYRLVWKREGCEIKRRRFIHLKRVINFVKLLKNDKPWEQFNENPDDYHCCSGYQCGCQGETVENYYKEKYRDYPQIEFIQTETREVGEWQPQQKKE